MSDKTIVMRCKAFSGEGVRNNRLLVNEDGTVRVFDSVAGIYTLCHSMSKAAERRARKLAQG